MLADQRAGRAGEAQGDVPHERLGDDGDLLPDLEREEGVDIGDQHRVRRVEEHLDRVGVDAATLLEVVLPIHRRVADRLEVDASSAGSEKTWKTDHLPREEASDASGEPGGCAGFNRMSSGSRSSRGRTERLRQGTKERARGLRASARSRASATSNTRERGPGGHGCRDCHDCRDGRPTVAPLLLTKLSTSVLTMSITPSMKSALEQASARKSGESVMPGLAGSG